MPIPSNMVKVVIFGTLPQGEIFETGFWVQASVTSQTALQDFADTERDNIETDFFPYIAQLASNDTTYDGVRCYSYPSGGPSAAYVAESLLTSAPGSGSAHLPNQLALCATLLTGASGRRNRGRMYLPANGVSLTDHQVDETVIDAVASHLAVHFERFEGTAAVLSQTAGSARPITAVRVDSLMDIQRRRANRETILRQHTSSLT